MQNRATRVMSEWHQMLRKELDAKRPILYTASTKSGGGHMFVIDGYTQENYYHVNWGWSGSSNGYYLLTVRIRQIRVPAVLAVDTLKSKLAFF